MAVSRKRRALLVLALFTSAACGVAAARVVPGDPGPCEGERRALVVDTDRRVLTVCDDGRSREVLSVRLGREGTGKTREGDRRTPTGRYPLGAPVASSDYGTFVPIEYPTVAQVRAGYTGSAVGVHGPGRRVRWLGRLVNVLDTTDGCVGLATDEETAAVASWVRLHPGATILIR